VKCGGKISSGNVDGNSINTNNQDSGSSSIAVNFYITIVAFISALIIYGY